MNKAVVTKNGIKYELQTDDLLSQEEMIWHKDTKNARVCFPVETYNANLHKLLAHNLGLDNHPFLAALVVAVQNGAFIRVDADGNVYYYCEYVEEVDEAIIMNYGGYVELKPVKP